ncbi:hypothetical protein D3C76_1490820 [compost metagenome]
MSVHNNYALTGTLSTQVTLGTDERYEPDALCGRCKRLDGRDFQREISGRDLAAHGVRAVRAV